MSRTPVIARAIARPAIGLPAALVVSADDPTRLLALYILARHSYRVIGAATLAEALERANLYPGRLALLVVDDAILDGNQPEAIPALLAIREEACPVALCSKKLLRNQLPGYVTIVPKPFTPPQLLTGVTLALAGPGTDRTVHLCRKPDVPGTGPAGT